MLTEIVKLDVTRRLELPDGGLRGHLAKG